MSSNADNELLSRIAAALERMAPPQRPDAGPGHAAYVWRAGVLEPVGDFRPVPIALLTGIDAQRDAVVSNTARLAAGHAAHDILLWGARGQGKSALVKAAVAALRGEGGGIGLVEVPNSELDTLPALFARLSTWPHAMIVFVDDLSFEGTSETARLLRSSLEGGATARPANVRLYVTSNRRHIVARDMAEQESAINLRDVVDDKLALADRFGLSLGFHVCDQETYLEMIAAYAGAFGLTFDAQEALTWSTQRGARSGRVAWHFIVELAGRRGIAL